MINLLSSRIWNKGTQYLSLRLSSTFDTNLPKWKELSIPIYCGHIAAKEWGPKEGLPVIAIHGWQDNAGTFDTLVPRLLPNLRIVAIDLLGHGLSSHKPRNSIYTWQERLMEVKHVADFMEWTQFSLLGHSMGGSISILFSCVFPEMIKNLILLDAPYPSDQSFQDISLKTKEAIMAYYKFEEKMDKKAPLYSTEKALDRLITGHLNEISEKSGKILLERAAKVSDDGMNLVFTRDIRIQILEALPVTKEVSEYFMSTLKCDTLLIKAKCSGFPKFNDAKLLKTFKELFSNYSKSFRYEEVDENHFVHLNNPDMISPIINSWLQSHTENKTL